MSEEKEENNFRREKRPSNKSFNTPIPTYVHNNYKKNNSLGLAWTDTRNYIIKNPRLNLEVNQKCIKHTHNDFRNLAGTLNLSLYPVYDTNIIVKNIDTFDMAKDFIDSGSTAILNMASDKKPGGGVESGARAQEECLARRSNLVLSLDKKYYPLQKDELLYSPEVTVFKDSEYNYLKEEFVTAVISCAAIRNPKLNLEGKFKREEYRLTYNKIEAIIKMALFYKINNLVLGAFGCGAFNNPPEEIASIYKEIIETEGLGKYFKKIGFAILVVKDKDNYNLECFQNIF